MSAMSEKSGAGPDLSGLLNGILSNPSALSAVASLLGNMGNGTNGAAHTQEAYAPEESPKPTPPLPMPKKDPRICLLDALRPYLSPARCEMMDTLLHIFELLALLQKKR